MAQQTAVKWLQAEFNKCRVFIPQNILERAKQMEKEQHCKTWDKALDAYEGRGNLYVRAWSDFDEYYNETYNETQTK